MRYGAIVTAAAVAAATAAIAAAGNGNSEREQLETQNPPARGIHWAKGHASPKKGGSADLIYHGGPVMTQGAYVEPVFWGPRWADPAFVSDKFSGVATFYQGIGGSNYEATDTEYTDSTGTHVGTTVAFGMSHVDLSSPPNNAGKNTASILAAACSAATNILPDGYYPVYVDTPRGHAGFCAWHSAGTCPNGVTVQFAFFFNLDGDPGCDPEDPSGLHSQGMAALANVSGHELSETLTDQHLNAWYDQNGAENSDKCAWSFGTPLLRFSNRSQWKIQGNWSNHAFDTNTGYPSLSGLNGCIDGGNFK